MAVDEIDEELMSKIRLNFESSPEVRALRTKQQLERSKGNFREAMECGQKIDALFVIVLNQYLREAENEVRSVDITTMGIPDGDRAEMMEEIVVLFMACDIIETAFRDLNDIFHRTIPDYDISTFSDIQQLADMAKAKLRYLQEKGDYMKDLIWVDKCDNMYAMMKSKAKSIIRKRKEDPNWGKNMEGYG